MNRRLKTNYSEPKKLQLTKHFFNISEISGNFDERYILTGSASEQKIDSPLVLSASNLKINETISSYGSHFILSSSVGSIIHTSGSLEIGNGEILYFDQDTPIYIRNNSNQLDIQHGAGNPRIRITGGNTQFFHDIIVQSTNNLEMDEGVIRGRTGHLILSSSVGSIVHLSSSAEIDESLTFLNDQQSHIVAENSDLILSSSAGSIIYASSSLVIPNGEILYFDQDEPIYIRNNGGQLDFRYGSVNPIIRATGNNTQFFHDVIVQNTNNLEMEEGVIRGRIGHLILSSSVGSEVYISSSLHSSGSHTFTGSLLVSEGNIGIRTTNPNNVLTVVGDADLTTTEDTDLTFLCNQNGGSDNTAFVKATGTGTNGRGQFLVGGSHSGFDGSQIGDGSATLEFLGDSGASNPTRYMLTNQPGGSVLKLDVVNDGTGGQVGGVMSWDTSGNVGINTTSVDEKLHVVDGNIKIENDGGKLELFNNTTGDVPFLHFRNQDTTADWIFKHTGSLHLQTEGSAGTEVMSWQSNGDVGIGITSPSTRLDVRDDVAGFVALIVNDGNNANRDVLALRGGADNGSGVTEYIRASDGDNDVVGRIQNNAGTFELVDVSDENLKTDIAPTQLNGLDTINQINPIEFRFKKQGSNAKKHTCGLSAQNVESVFPEAVSARDNTKGIARTALIPVIIQSIKELTERVKQLENNNGPI